jgi:hypothetical protein
VPMSFQVIAQLERSTLMAFCGLPAYQSVAEAAGGRIGVDSTTMGFIMVGYRAFAKAGIEALDRDEIDRCLAAWGRLLGGIVAGERETAKRRRGRRKSVRPRRES